MFGAVGLTTSGSSEGSAEEGRCTGTGPVGPPDRAKQLGFAYDVWGSGPDDVWAAGFGIPHWNGSTWQSFPGALGAYGLWGSGPNDVWGVGGYEAIIYHWNGSGWSTFTSGVAQQDVAALNGVWGSESSDVWAVGSGGAILHWDGVAWSTTASPISKDGPELFDVWGSGPNDVWAVGGLGTGTILHR